jgi:uracil-DNA glycosylase family 4
MNNILSKLNNLNKSLKPPGELGGRFLPVGYKEKFDFMFVAEMPSMNEPKKISDKYDNFNFSITARDKFFQEMMIKNDVAGSYVTDIVKQRDIPRRPTKQEIQKWLPFLIKEIEIIKPKAIIVLGRRTYDASFKPFIEPFIPKNIKVDYVFHYSQQGAKTNAEVQQRFSEVIDNLENAIKI